MWSKKDGTDRISADYQLTILLQWNNKQTAHFTSFTTNATEVGLTHVLSAKEISKPSKISGSFVMVSPNDLRLFKSATRLHCKQLTDGIPPKIPSAKPDAALLYCGNREAIQREQSRTGLAIKETRVRPVLVLLFIMYSRLINSRDLPHLPVWHSEVSQNGAVDAKVHVWIRKRGTSFRQVSISV